MKIFTTANEVSNFLEPLKTSTSSFGFVPTMGALHMGHVSLIKKACKENNIVIVSIYVNPTQFDKKNDLNKYPKNLKKDINILRSLNEDKVVLFTPDNKEIYGARTTKEKFSFGSVENKLEGKFRPGHFEGVATVVKKLLKIVRPDKAYFGEKDFQQLLIIKKLVVAMGARTLIVGCPIFREPNGLAMSSRNSLLTKAELQYASKIYNVLKIVKEKFKESSLEIIKKWVLNEFENDTLFKIEYFEITDSLSLEIATSVNNTKKYRAFISGYIRNVRLIDNIALN